ncbi:hypothetical protein [Anaeromassilibacillus sp. An200]|uniref:hypothetical protein n=1 Tax=Anaeromassilibacillus sp. An200 TaxID=1965587 RepID=UPI0013A664DB|nr:hypothetical protein [Anaeromassilibacillus sp. An200]
MEKKKERIALRDEGERRSKPVFFVTLLPPPQEERLEEWLYELEREAANLIQRRLQ